jgi:hypothetical protein
MTATPTHPFRPSLDALEDRSLPSAGLSLRLPTAAHVPHHAGSARHLSPDAARRRRAHHRPVIHHVVRPVVIHRPVVVVPVRPFVHRPVVFVNDFGAFGPFGFWDFPVGFGAFDMGFGGDCGCGDFGFFDGGFGDFGGDFGDF